MSKLAYKNKCLLRCVDKEAIAHLLNNGYTHRNAHYKEEGSNCIFASQSYSQDDGEHMESFFIITTLKSMEHNLRVSDKFPNSNAYIEDCGSDVDMFKNKVLEKDVVLNFKEQREQSAKCFATKKCFKLKNNTCKYSTDKCEGKCSSFKELKYKL